LKFERYSPALNCFLITHTPIEAKNTIGCPLAAKTNRFHRRVKTDFVAKLEAVIKRFLGAVDAYVHTVELMNFHTCREGLIFKTINYNRRIFQPGNSAPG
jgi:hypothetical protein